MVDFEQVNDSFEGGWNLNFFSCSKTYFDIAWKASRVQILLRSFEYLILEKLSNMTPKESDKELSETLGVSETAVCRCSSKYMFLNFFGIFSETHLCWNLFLIKFKPSGLQLY